jgi:integrase
VRYRRHSDQRPRKYTLPGFPSLGAARKLAQAALDLVATGGDPAADRKAALAAAQAAESGDLGEALAEFLAKHNRRKDGRQIRESTKRQTAALLGFRRDPANPGAWVPTGNGVRARWQGRTVASIRQADVLGLLDDLAQRTPTKANRILSALKTFFAWRMRRDETLGRSPCANVSDPSPERSRERVLTDAELAALWRAAEAEGYPFGPMIQLLILTGTRRDEARAAPWREIDLEGRQWLIPAGRTKNGRDHLVPLSEPAAAILARLPRMKGSPFLFTTTGRTPVSGLDSMKRRLAEAMAHELGAAPEDWRLHDIRRSFVTGLQRLGFPLEVTEAAVNHKGGSLKGVAATYARHDYQAEKERALAAWGRHVEALVGGGPANVIPLRREA